MNVVTPSKSEGHLALRRWMKATGNVIADLARSTGFSNVIVGKIVGCVRAPGPHLAPALVKVTGIPMEAWYPEAKIDPLTVEVPDGKDRAGRPRSSEGERGVPRAPNARIEAQTKLHQVRSRGQRGRTARRTKPPTRPTGTR